MDRREYLDTSGEAPMRVFAESLLRALGGPELVLIYFHFEKTILRSLQHRFPDLAVSLGGLIDRLVDLHPPMRWGYYHSDQQGNWSIKAVAPLIEPDVRYEDLDEVQEGGGAQGAYLEMIDPQTTPESRHPIERQLLDYCRLDTLSLVRIVEKLSGHKPSGDAADHAVRS